MFIWMEKNSQHAKSIIDTFKDAAKARIAARKARDLIKRKGALSELSSALPGKLADCQEKDPKKSELFIVEGESAGGTTKKGRDRKYQAVLPLRGKILNVEKARFDKIFSSEQIKILILALGAGIGKEEFDINKVRYQKIIIMTDADVDGAHIRTLLLTFFFRNMPQIIENGYLYIAQPPLFQIQLSGNKEIYIKDQKELNQYVIKSISKDCKFTTNNKEMTALDIEKFLNQVAQYKELTKRLPLRIEYTNALGSISEALNYYQDIEHNLEALLNEVKNKLIKTNNKSFQNVQIAFNKETKSLVFSNEIFGILERQELSLQELKLGNINSLFQKFREIFTIHNQITQVEVCGEKIDLNNLQVSDLFDFVVKIGTEKLKNLQRFKGLGEMNADQLKKTTLDQKERVLIKVNVVDAIEADKIFSVLMGDDVLSRREFIQQNAINVSNLDF